MIDHSNEIKAIKQYFHVVLLIMYVYGANSSFYQIVTIQPSFKFLGNLLSCTFDSCGDICF